MDAKQVTYQAPRPEIKVYSPEGKLKLQFDTSNRKGLQSYSFKTSVNDVQGQFTLVFHPDEFKYSNDAKPIFDEIQELDIVEIYESKNHFKQYYRGAFMEKEVLPTFTGIVRKKKHASRIGGDTVSRRLTISGHSVAGLVSNFYINMDSTAMAVTQRYKSQEDVSKKLTINLMPSEPVGKPFTEVVSAIWDAFIGIANSGGDYANPKIAEIIQKWIGGVSDIFDIEEGLTFHYPIGCIFDGKSTKSFFDLIAGIIPTPPYERFAYCERDTGKMRIKIRQCPFEAGDWEKIKSPECYEIPAELAKAIEIEQNDNEVNTVFFSYLDNSPISPTMALKLSTMKEAGDDPRLVRDAKKYAIYGYRPLFVHFKGYGKAENKDDKSTGEKILALNKKLMRWYKDVELMYKGTLTLATKLSIDMPQAGEKISILGGEFYVDASEHKWNFGGSPETILSISRGGVYEGEFSELKYWGRPKIEGKTKWMNLI